MERRFSNPHRHRPASGFFLSNWSGSWFSPEPHGGYPLSARSDFHFFLYFYTLGVTHRASSVTDIEYCIIIRQQRTGDSSSADFFLICREIMNDFHLLDITNNEFRLSLHIIVKSLDHRHEFFLHRYGSSCRRKTLH